MELNHSALDTETMALVQPQQEDATPAEETETEVNESVEEQVEQSEETQSEETVEETATLSIDGIGEVKLDDIKEWQKGYLRQSDYTKKTQELAKQREEAAAALEVFNYLQENPHLVEQLKLIEGANVNTEILNQSTPETDMLREVWYNQKSMEIDRQVERLKATYGDVDEVALFNKAAELGTENLEEAYKIIAFNSTPALSEQELINKAKEELKKELQQNKDSVRTVVSTNSNTPVVRSVTLTNEEKRVAAKMGMSESEYAKWR